MAFSGNLAVKESDCQCKRLGFYPWVRKIPWRKKWQLTPVFLPGKSPRQRSLASSSDRDVEKLINWAPRSPNRIQNVTDKLLCWN